MFLPSILYINILFTTNTDTFRPTKSPSFVSYDPTSSPTLAPVLEDPSPTHKPSFSPDYTHRPTKSPSFISYEPTHKPSFAPDYTHRYNIQHNINNIYSTFGQNIFLKLKYFFWEKFICLHKSFFVSWVW